MTKILIGATLTKFAMNAHADIWGAWLMNKQERDFDKGLEIGYFAALELDAAGFGPFEKLFRSYLGVEYWTYQYDDKRMFVSTANRGRHIAAGRNMVFDYAWEHDYDYVLMMDADISLRDDTIDKLLEVDHPVVGAYCSTFCQDGPNVEGKPGDVRAHLATGCTLIHKDVYRAIRYGPADDWGFMFNCKDQLDIQHYVRHDAIVTHYPVAIPPLESRGHDLTVQR